MAHADNINTEYLGNPAEVAAGNLNTSQQSSEATFAFLSDVSVADQLFTGGILQVGGALNSASAISGGALTVTTGVFSGAVDTASAVSTGELTSTGGNFSSTITSTDGDFLSVDSQADSSGMTVGQLRLVFAASGVSLMYSSGESEYIVNSATSLAQS